MAWASLEVVLVPLAGLHVGGDPGLRGFELPLARDPRGVPFIPSTSVRGALRTAAYLAAETAGLKVCGEREPGEIEGAHRRLFGRPDVLCPVCGVWGAPGFESALYVTDFTPTAPTVTFFLPHLEIDDYTGRARRGALYYEEVVPPGTPFEGRLALNTGLIRERVESGRVGGVSGSCALYKLVAASLLLLPLVGLGRGSAPVAAFVKDPPSNIGCSVDALLNAVKWEGFTSLADLASSVFESIPGRVRLVTRELGGGEG